MEAKILIRKGEDVQGLSARPSSIIYGNETVPDAIKVVKEMQG